MIRYCRFLALACLCLVLGIVSVSCSGNEADAELPKLPPMPVKPYPGLQRSDVTLAIELSDERSTRTIFRALPWQPADSEYARSVAEKLGAVGEPKQEADGSYIVKSELGEINVQSVGDFDYTPTVPQATSVSSAQPGDDELNAAAEAFLSGYDLLPPHAKAVSVSYDKHTSQPSVRIEDERLTPNLGLTPHIYVNFDEAGSVSSVVFGWQPIEALGDYPLLSEKEAFERIFEANGRMGAVKTPIEISSVQLTFHNTGNEREGLPTFFPFYWFRGEDDKYIWVSAVPDEYLEEPAQ